MGRSMVILNSVEAATDLMEKRSSNYSDRPPIRVFSLCEVQHIFNPFTDSHELTSMGWKKVLSFIRYGKEFQLHRKIFQQHLHKLQNKSYRPLLLTEARALAQNLLGDPKEKNNIVARYTYSGIRNDGLTTDEDRYVLLANEVGRAMATAGALGSSLLDFLPFREWNQYHECLPILSQISVQYMPSWFPGTYYANYARKWAPKVREFRDLPFEDVQRQMKEGTAKPCLLVSELEALEHRAIDSKKTIEDIKGATSTAYLAGVETAKAQAELDAVVGSQRLPEFDDRDSLPYLECLLHETLRWQSPLPTGIPRLTIDDDVYRGMFIPKGSVVIGNVRGMSWDERTYANPFSFEPTRYLPAPLGRGEPRPEAHWGFGRR
ncbi:hypothetical protein H0H81_002872 [Sphagnurus paluster]|uniref:Cytochrome P450 n=1 Tax=Sphagnurus paluster TaxID=117069 RepID=A0A9P7GLP8_9AGAR|nr:hypothetical protein H0H81_002872 [Sphagnurus paluster]